MGGVEEGSKKEGSDGAGTGDDVQGSGSEDDALGDLELGSDGFNDVGVLPLGRSEGSKDISSTIWVGVVRVVIGGRDLGGGGAVSNEGVNSEATGCHCGIYCKSPHL